jgi:hypothetical protein
VEYTYLWFAISNARPVRSWPAFTKIGVSRRHRTWYQCVSGSVGAVDSHIVCTEPMNATSNQNARPCTVPDSKRWKSNGTSVKEPRLFNLSYSSQHWITNSSIAQQLSAEPSDAQVWTGVDTHHTSTSGCESLLLSACTRGCITVFVFILPSY